MYVKCKLILMLTWRLRNQV